MNSVRTKLFAGTSPVARPLEGVIAQMLAPLIADPRNPALARHSVADILRARMLAIAFGYEDADDLLVERI
jgi:hypothetical protein